MRWEDNNIQFVRLVVECYGVLTESQLLELCSSMDLDLADLIFLFERAEKVWDEIK
jgi:hypothetical protein